MNITMMTSQMLLLIFSVTLLSSYEQRDTASPSTQLLLNASSCLLCLPFQLSRLLPCDLAYRLSHAALSVLDLAFKLLASHLSSPSLRFRLPSVLLFAAAARLDAQAKHAQDQDRGTQAAHDRGDIASKLAAAPRVTTPPQR